MKQSDVLERVRVIATSPLAAACKKCLKDYKLIQAKFAGPLRVMPNDELLCRMVCSTCKTSFDLIDRPPRKRRVH